MLIIPVKEVKILIER